jgi:divalent metal cation (Fe/Co/Zn/Cd) transporter
VAAHASVADAHTLADAVETRIKVALGEAEVTVDIDPARTLAPPFRVRSLRPPHRPPEQ